VTEAQLQAAVIECARLLGWRVAHFRPALTVKGWRTPVAGDGAGFPDLVLVRRGRLIFAELKSATGVTSVDQTVWLRELFAVGRESDDVVEAFVWQPGHWLSGEIERTLR
jgi:hypothetical protein